MYVCVIQRQGSTATPRGCAPHPAGCAPWRRSLCCASLCQRSRQQSAVLPACIAVQQRTVSISAQPAHTQRSDNKAGVMVVACRHMVSLGSMMEVGHIKLESHHLRHACKVLRAASACQNTHRTSKAWSASWMSCEVAVRRWQMSCSCTAHPWHGMTSAKDPWQ